jgi:hypothetical protein
MSYFENEKAHTKILDVLKFESKYDEEVFNRLPLTDRQKEQILFDIVPELKEYKNIFGSNIKEECQEKKSLSASISSLSLQTNN